jgi:Glycosyl hydrolase family 115/Gylcosyl hydrolase family 115 C-terminal domain
MRFPALRRFLFLLSMIAMCAAASRDAHSLGQKKYVSGLASKGSMTLVARGHVASIYVDSADFPGVMRATHDLQMDIERVSGMRPSISSDSTVARDEIVLIGTLGKSSIIDRLVNQKKLDVSAIAGKWESTLIAVIEKPMPGVERALVIAGSDKRGTIFGIYDLSEQIGVSPWYWWADVPVQHKAALYVSAGHYVSGEPAVKYRGIFLNDEAPALTGWVNATYGGYNHKFYITVFELLLRLKANYLWPAMWGSAFNEDDPENARLADEYGIVMGTSHHEPMLRAQQEWKRHGTGPWDYAANGDVLRKFWNEGIERNKNFESTVTLGMRGDGDMPMTEGENIALLETIVSDQSSILDAHSTPALRGDPKVWALYKEVQAYYEKGMRVPDDVTLLWCDDNWGNIRRLPTPEERKRPGGAGIYYHFDYVGDPRNYKWIDTNPIAKVWEQMHLAHVYGADRIWIVNVGDLKPMEFPIDFFLNYARDPERWDKDHLQEFTRAWADREFGAAHAEEIAAVVTRYGRYIGRRKPELMDADTFSLVNYHEAERVEEEWKTLREKAEALNAMLPENERDAYFELVLHPIKAAEIVTGLYINAGRSRLNAKEGRADANDYAERARALFRADAALSDEYNHKLAGGKWNHMMDQTHIGYTYWQEPPLNAMPAVSEVQALAKPRMGVIADGDPAPAVLAFDSLAQQRRTIDVFNRGNGSFHFEAKASRPWIVLSAASGDVEKAMRVEVWIDWSLVPEGKSDGEISMAQANGATATLPVSTMRATAITRESLEGFAESDGLVSIEAEHYSRALSAGTVRWEKIPDYGETLSGMSAFPVDAASALPPSAVATLEYRMYLFDEGHVNLQATLGPSLNFVPGRGLRFTVSFDDQPPQIVDVLEDNSQSAWAKAVSDGVRRVDVKLNSGQPGYHTLKIGMVDPGVVLEKLVVSFAPVKPSYLGPPESFHHLAAQ